MLVSFIPDFERGFIRAEVTSYDDYVQYGGESGAKEAGRQRLEGKEYIMQRWRYRSFQI